MEDFDIYDDLELLHAQQKEKEDEELQWKEKYQVAIATIEKLQSEKKGLNKKIKQLEINFASLLDTARSEIKRKDNQIYELRKEKDNICFRRNARSLNKQSVDYGEDQRRADRYVNPFVGEPNDVVFKHSDEKTKATFTKQENIETDKRCSKIRREPSPHRAREREKYRDRNQQYGRDTHRNDKSSNPRYKRHDRNTSETKSSDSKQERSEKSLTSHTQRGDHTNRPHSRDSHTNYEKSYTSPHEHTTSSRHERHSKDKQQRSELKEGNPKKCIINDFQENEASSVKKDVSQLTKATPEEEILKDVKALKKVKKTEDEKKEVNLEAEKLQAATQKSNTFLDALFDDLETTNQEEQNKDCLYEDLVIPIPTIEKSVKIATKIDENCNLKCQQVTPVKQPVSRIFEELFGPSPAGSTSTVVDRRTSLSSIGGSSCDASVFIPNGENGKPIQRASADPIINISINVEKSDKKINEDPNLQTGEAVNSAKTFQFVELDSSFYSSDDDDSNAEGQKESQSDIDSPPFEKCRLSLNDSVISNESESNGGENSDTSGRLLHTEQRLDTAMETILDCELLNLETDHLNDDPKSSSNEGAQDNNIVQLSLDKDRENIQRKDSHRLYHHSRKYSTNSTSSRSRSSHKEKSHRSERSRHEDNKHHHDRSSSRKHSDDRHHSLRKKTKKKIVNVQNDLVEKDLVKKKKELLQQDENSSDLKLYQDQVILLQCDDISDEEGYEANIEKRIHTKEQATSLRCEELIMIANITSRKDPENVNGEDSTVNSSNIIEQSSEKQNYNIKPIILSCVNEDINEKTKGSESISTTDKVVETTEMEWEKGNKQDCEENHPALLLAEDDLKQSMDGKELFDSCVIPEIATSTSEDIENILDNNSVVVEKGQPPPPYDKFIHCEMIATEILIEKTITEEQTKLVVNDPETLGETESTTPSLLDKGSNSEHVAKEVEKLLEQTFEEGNKSIINHVTLIAEVKEQFQVRTEEEDLYNENPETVSNTIPLIAGEHMEKDTITEVSLDKCVPIVLNDKDVRQEVDQSSFSCDSEHVNSFSQEQTCNLIISDASKSSEDTEESTSTGRRKKLKTPKKCTDIITGTTKLMTMVPSLKLTCDDKSDPVPTQMLTESYNVDLLPPIREIKSNISEDLPVSPKEEQPEMPVLWVDDESTEAVTKSVRTNPPGTQITHSIERNDEPIQHKLGIAESEDLPTGLIAKETSHENKIDLETNFKAAETKQEVEVTQPGPPTDKQTECEMILIEIPIEEPTTEERIEIVKNSSETLEPEDMASDVITPEITSEIDSDLNSNIKAIETSQVVESEVKSNEQGVETSHEVSVKVLKDKSENTYKGVNDSLRSEESLLNIVPILRKRPRNNDEVVQDQSRTKSPKQQKRLLQDSTTFCSKDKVYISKALVSKSDEHIDVIDQLGNLTTCTERVIMSPKTLSSDAYKTEEQKDMYNHSQHDNKLNFVEQPIDMIGKQSSLQNSSRQLNTCELIIKNTIKMYDAAVGGEQPTISDAEGKPVQTPNEKDKKENSPIIPETSNDTEVPVNPYLDTLDDNANTTAAKKSSLEKKAFLEKSDKYSCLDTYVSDGKPNNHKPIIKNAATHDTNDLCSATHTDKFEVLFAQEVIPNYADNKCKISSALEKQTETLLTETDLTSNIQKISKMQSEEMSSALHKHPIGTCDNKAAKVISVSEVPPTVSDQNELHTSAKKPDSDCIDHTLQKKKYKKKISKNSTDSKISETTVASQSQEKLMQLSSSCNPESQPQCIDSVDDIMKEHNHNVVPVVSDSITTECILNRESKTQQKKKMPYNSDGTTFAGNVEPSLENINAFGVCPDNELQFKGHLPLGTSTTDDKNNRKTKSTVSKGAPSTKVFNDNAHVQYIDSTVKSPMSREENKPNEMNSSGEEHYSYGDTNVACKPLKKYKKRISQDATNWAWKNKTPTCSKNENLDSHNQEPVSIGCKRKYVRKTSTPTTEQTQTLVETTPKPKRKYTKKKNVCSVPEAKDTPVVVKFPTTTTVALEEPTSQELQSAIDSITFCSQEPDTCSFNVQPVETSIMSSSTTFSEKSLLQDERESNPIYIKRRMKPSKHPTKKRKISTSICDTSNISAVPLSNISSSPIELEIFKRSVSQEKSLPAGTPTHKIFHDDVFPDPDSLPPVYNANGDDIQYQEIENRMRSIFQSPTYPHLNSLEMANPSNSCVELQVDITKGDITINETLEQSEKSQCDTSTSSKKLSVGSNDYVIETVGAHTANVFITRRKFKKRTKVSKTSSVSTV